MRRGYWRESGDAVSAEEAWDIWAPHAYDVLLEVARRYRAIITYGEVGKEVQDRSGVRTSALLQNWIGTVLGRVVRRAHNQGHPPLTALVVHKDDGKVGVGYAEVLQIAGQPPVEDDMQRERHAASARLDCYRYFEASGLPADGGQPALAPRLEEAVRRQRRNAPQPRHPTCSRCGIQLPVSGVCSYCD
ncbi:hypothetical protein [Micromonospora sp. NPDC005367]|uniref:hypothetical protein n=1 Tax=Micromonospora sp. NPDC005367 TaxID=3155590 RepID=UPI0033A28B7E